MKTYLFVLLLCIASVGASAQIGLRAKRIYLQPPTLTITEVKTQPVSNTCLVNGQQLPRPAYLQTAVVSFTANKTDLSRYGLVWASIVSHPQANMEQLRVPGDVAFDGSTIKGSGDLTARVCVSGPIAAQYSEQVFQLALYEKDETGKLTSNIAAVSNISQPVRFANPNAVAQVPFIRVYSTRALPAVTNACSFTSPTGPVGGTGLEAELIVETANRGAAGSLYFEEVKEIIRNGVSGGTFTLKTPFNGTGAHNSVVLAPVGICATFGSINETRVNQITMTVQYRCYAATSSGQKTGPVLFQTPVYSFTYARPSGAARQAADAPPEPALQKLTESRARVLSAPSTTALSTSLFR